MRWRYISLASILLLTSVLSGQDYQVRTRVDVVVVPTTVTDSDDKLVAGLTQKDFSIREDDIPQTIVNFSSDPQQLSAAIIVDTGMGGIAMRRLAPLFISVTGGFSIFDEMASFRYDHFVHQLSDFTGDPEQIERSFAIVKTIAEQQSPNVQQGDPAPTAPRVVRLLLGFLNIGPQGTPPVPTASPTILKPNGQSPYGPGAVPSSRVLYDALYEAARALEQRPSSHRKIIFIISDGQVRGPTHNREDTLNLLIRDQIQLYAVTTDGGAFEGQFSVLQSFAEATGGDVFQGLSTSAMEGAFSRITEQARNQYVLGYQSTNRVGMTHPVFREIEVTTRNPKLKVTHRKGYYQAP